MLPLLATFGDEALPEKVNDNKKNENNMKRFVFCHSFCFFIPAWGRFFKTGEFMEY